MSQGPIAYKGETITATMARVREANFHYEEERSKHWGQKGVKHPEIVAHIDATFGEASEEPSPTPRVDMSYIHRP